MPEKRIRKKSESLPQKSKKKGCFFWVFLGLLVGGGLVYSLGDRLLSLLPIEYQTQVSGWVAQVSDFFGEEEPVVEEAPPVEVEVPQLPAKPKPKPTNEVKPQPGEQLHYVRVGGCMAEECRNLLTKEMELLKLPVLVKKYRQQTTYYELISKDLFKHSRAENKLVEIDRHAPQAPPATLRKEMGLWRVTLGEFPDRRQAVLTKSYLAQLYPDVDLNLLLAPRVRSFDLEYIYVGPFSSKFNAISVAELIRDKRFVQETYVTPNP